MKAGSDATLKASFPSDTFLQKYFGQDQSRTSPPAYGGRPQRLYSTVRAQFHFVLVYAPCVLIRQEDRKRQKISTKFVYQDGHLSEKSTSLLIDRLLLEPNEPNLEAYERDLLAELKEQFAHGRLRNIDWWWQWFVTDDNIGIKLTPDANRYGGNQPQRTLRELLDGA